MNQQPSSQSSRIVLLFSVKSKTRKKEVDNSLTTTHLVNWLGWHFTALIIPGLDQTLATRNGQNPYTGVKEAKIGFAYTDVTKGEDAWSYKYVDNWFWEDFYTLVHIPKNDKPYLDVYPSVFWNPHQGVSIHYLSVPYTPVKTYFLSNIYPPLLHPSKHLVYRGV